MRPLINKLLLPACLLTLIVVDGARSLPLDENDESKTRAGLHEPGFNPVIFIPGDGGSQLEAKLNKPARVHYICDLVSDWYDLWLNIHLLTPLAFDCLIDNMMLHYNRTSRLTQNSPGVQVRPTNFGALSSVAYLDTVRLYKTDYFETIIATLEKKNNLVRDKDMLGASFDFRKAPNELQEFFANLTSLIEEHYIKSNYEPVTLICHSMGCLNTVYMLNRKSQNWKDVFIRRMVTLGAPWSGSFKAISAMLHGDNLGIPLLDNRKLRELQSSFPSLMYLMPREPAFSPNRVLVETPNKNYTLKNLDQLFLDADLPDQLEMWKETSAIAASLKAPNVEIWCLYGSMEPTPSKLIYDGPITKNGSAKYKELNDDGDATVNLESLRTCEDFAFQQEKPVFSRMFESVDHIDILRGSQAADFISTEILTLE